MKFRDYFSIPQNLILIPAGILDLINAEAAKRDGIVSFYLPVPLKYPTRTGWKYQTVYALIEYNIDTDKIHKLFPYRKVKIKGQIPDPDPKAVNGHRLFTPSMLPPPVRDMLKEKCQYYKSGAKK